METVKSTACCAQNSKPPASTLTPREREFVALGAALASNCVPCIEYHIKEARTVGLTDTEISAAIQLADYVRRVPATKVLDVASRLLTKPVCQQPASAAPAVGATAESCC